MNRFTTVIFFTIISIMIFGMDVVGATKISSQSGNWSATTTWGGNPVPVAGDDVIINGGFTVTVDISNAACLSLQLGGSALNTGSGTLSFTNGSQLTVTGAVNVGPFNNNTTPGSLTMASGGTLICDGITVGKLGTWTDGTGTIELTASNTIPADNNVNFNNLIMSGGTTTLSRNVGVNGNLIINLGAALDGGANTLTVGGDWTNNGTFTGNTGTVTFAKNGNQKITGTGINNFNLIRVNMGTNINNTLEVLASNFNAPDAFLTLTNGTFKVSGTFSFSNTFILGPIYNIQPTSGLWINNPNVTVTAQAGGVSVRGLLRLSAGTYNIGTAIDNSLDYVAGSTITIEGGALNIAGRLTRNNATATTSYTQSGGTVTVVGQGSTDITFGGFDLGAVGSSFTMSGGTIVIRNSTSAPSDYVNASSVANVTGGTLQIGDASTQNAQIIRIQSSRPVGNLLISNATAQSVKPKAQLITSSLNVTGGVTIQSGTTLDANGLNISLGGDWVNNGTFTSGGNTVTFNGSGAQALTATSGETFNALVINKVGGALSLNNSAVVNSTFSLTQGTLAVGANTLSLNSIVTGAGSLTSGTTGTVNYNQTSPGQNILAGNYGNLTFSDFNKILSSSGTIGIAGTFTPGSALGHTITGSTIDFNGGTQIIPAFTYNNLTASGSGTKTGAGIISVNGNLTNSLDVLFSSATILNLNGTTHVNEGTLSASTISIGSGSTLTNNGTVTSSSLLNGSGTFTQGTTGILNIGGTIGITTLNVSAAGNTVNYTGAGQTVTPMTYHNLTLSGSGIPILTGLSTINGTFTLSGTVAPTAATGMTISGNFSIGSGTSFTAGSFSHILKGNLSNSGTFNAGTSSFTFNGTSAQTVSSANFKTLIINNAAGVSMLSDETVDSILTLTNGAFYIGPYSLTLNGALSLGAGSLIGGTLSNIVVSGSGGSVTLPAITLNNFTLNRASGDSLSGDATINGVLAITKGTLNTGVNKVLLGQSGTLSETAGDPVVGVVTTSRNITAMSGVELFGNIGVDINLNGVALGNTTVVRKTGIALSGNGHNSIKRYFDITPATNTGLNAGLVFHYDSTELNGQKANTLEFYRSRDNGTTWNNLGGTINLASRTVVVTGINDFSRWTTADTSNVIGSTATPATTSISPPSKYTGNSSFTLTVNGAEFVSGKSTVRFNGSDRTTAYVSSTQVTAAIPASDLLNVGSYPVTVFTSGGGAISNAQMFVVNPIPPTKVRVETAANGSGTIVGSQSLVAGSSITVYGITRDSLNNFVANVAADAWTLENITGGVVAGDLVPAVDGKSAMFTGHVIGTADIKATSGLLTTTPSGTITVTAGMPSKVRVETAVDGSGKVFPADTLVSGSSVTVYSITRDSLNNFVANVAADAWSLQNITGAIVANDLAPAQDSKSAVFTGHAAGSANIKATSGSLTTTSSGTIIVTSTTGVLKESIPIAFVLSQNYPNPFNPSTTIQYGLPAGSTVRLVVYNILGQVVKELVNAEQQAGYQSVVWNADVASGIYFYRLEATSVDNAHTKFVEMKKMLLMK
ncbi:MAG: T9SS type A sorting domain-containing protein [Bacteroidota bacterium]|nr:T9SS type A sorting domain-containing protein [Bacteroidota bacterium]